MKEFFIIALCVVIAVAWIACFVVAVKSINANKATKKQIYTMIILGFIAYFALAAITILLATQTFSFTTFLN